MMNALCLSYAGPCKMLEFVYSFLSYESPRLLKVLCVCVLGLLPVVSPGHAPTGKAKHVSLSTETSFTAA